MAYKLSLTRDLIGKKNLTGASNYWQMVVSLRPYFFQVCYLDSPVHPFILFLYSSVVPHSFNVVLNLLSFASLPFRMQMFERG